MLDQIPITAESGAVAAEAPATSQPVPPDQSQPSGDSRLAAILQKKSAGEKLSPADRGYLGAVKRRGTPKTVATPANQNPLLEQPTNPDNPLFEASQEAVAPAAGVVATAVDSAHLRETAESLLDALDSVTQTYVGYEAQQAGANEETVRRYESAVAMQHKNRKLMVEGSEPVVLGLCKIFKCSPERLEAVLKSSGFVGGLAMHTIAVVTTVKSIRESQKENASQPKP